MNRRELIAAMGATAGLTSLGQHADAAPQGHDRAKAPTPADAFHLYLCAFHIAKKNPSFIVEAHHYCSPVSDEVHQCVIFDSSGKNARILGIEYIISDALYRKLPDGEKRYYHPHSYEILSGLLVAPDLSEDDEHKLMGGLITTWGKTWHTWPDPATSLPMGEPLLMWSASKDGHIPAATLDARDRRINISTPDKRRRRAVYGPVPQIDAPSSIESLGRQFTNEGPDIRPATGGR